MSYNKNCLNLQLKVKYRIGELKVSKKAKCIDSETTPRTVEHNLFHLEIIFLHKNRFMN